MHWMSAAIKPRCTLSLKVDWQLIAPYQGFACDSPKVYLCSTFWKKKSPASTELGSALQQRVKRRRKEG